MACPAPILGVIHNLRGRVIPTSGFETRPYKGAARGVDQNGAALPLT